MTWSCRRALGSSVKISCLSDLGNQISDPPQRMFSSIAVWVRLNELPIEYYESHILKHIGSSIGNVLRVDTHTAVEARGRYARLCVQIDINKLLVSTVLIGDLEQPVLYEGISRLCFSCGRVGHRKESCPYTIRSPSSLAKEDNSPSPLASPPLGPIHCKRVQST